MSDIELPRLLVAGNDKNDFPVLNLKNLGCPVAVGDEITRDMQQQLPPHTIFIRDQKKLGAFISERIQTK
jgi:hypothetical protein